jgi:hypothetical protein
VSDNSSWYITLDSTDPLSQGELIKNCPVIIPPKKLDQKKYILNVKQYDVIIISQSCDIEQEKIDYILLCPFYTLNKLEKISPLFKNPIGKEVLRRGNINGLHLLNICPYIDEYLVVDFRKVFSIFKSFLLNHVNEGVKRITLKSPYREHLSQTFARFFMRVGLPSDIPPFADEIYKI